MGFLFDQTEKNERLSKAAAKSQAIDSIMNLIIAHDPEAASRMKLIKKVKSVTEVIIDKIVDHDFTDKLTNEQLNEVEVYLEMMLTGFNTFMEQFESTIKKENPHSSGN